MFDLSDKNDLKRFKNRLGKTRKERKLTQDAFAEALGDNNRSRVANWESEKSTTLLPLHELPRVCKLLETDPNYLLGFSDDISTNDTMIADTIHFSSDNVHLLRHNPYAGKFLDALLSSDEFFHLMNNVQRVAMYGFFLEPLEKTFSPSALTQLYKAYEKFRSEVFPLDMDVVKFSYYVESAFPWVSEKQSFEELLHSIIIDERYYEMLFSNPEFMRKSDSEKYVILMVEIAKASYKHLSGKPIIELAEQEISKLLGKMVDDFIQDEIIKFKTREKQ